MTDHEIHPHDIATPPVITVEQVRALDRAMLLITNFEDLDDIGLRVSGRPFSPQLIVWDIDKFITWAKGA